MRISKKSSTFVLEMLVYLSLGSNVGDRSAVLDAACRLLAERVGPLVRRSSVYRSMPWGYVSDHEYMNICVVVETGCTPHEVLLLTQAIERELGRTVKNCYADRTIDIDLLFCDPSCIVCEPDLILPHPRMSLRDFVMIPLSEILF